MQVGSETSRANSTISVLTSNCISSFEKCQSLPSDIDQATLQNRLADLRLWADGVGALANDKASLDWRFRTRPDELMLVKTLLTMLLDFLDDYRDEANDGEPTGDALQCISSSLENLALIGVAIRRTGKASRRRKVDSCFDAEKFAELRRHLECIVLLRPSKAGLPDSIDPSGLSQVQQRLIEANLMRRHRIVVAHKRSGKGKRAILSQGGDLSVAETTLDKPSSGHDATETADEDAYDDRVVLKDISAKRTTDGFSAASTAEGTLRYSLRKDYAPGSAKSHITVVGADTDFPLPPRNPDGRLIGKCPCCCQAIPIEEMADSDKWRQHIIEDMCPYTCVIEECPNPTQLFSTRKEWEAHVKADHTPRWRCPLCTNEQAKLYSEDDTIQHFQTTHPDAIENFSLSTMLSWSKSVPMGIFACPLCSSFGREDSPEIVDHVLNHVYDFSLRALPWPIPTAHDLRKPIGTYVLPSNGYDAQRLLEWISSTPIEILEDLAPPSANLRPLSEGIQLCEFDFTDHDNTEGDHVKEYEYVNPSEYFDTRVIDDSERQQGDPPTVDSSLSAATGSDEMPTTEGSCASRTVILDPMDYKIAWIAPLEIEARAAMHLLDEQHHGRFPVNHGNNYVFLAGTMGGHNIIIATLPAGEEYGTGSVAALTGQVKKLFPNLWFGLLVGVAAGLPDLSRDLARDIRLGDVLVGLPDGESAGLVPYNLGKETEDGFQPLRLGHSLAMTEPIVRAAIGNIKLEAPYDTKKFLPYYEKIRDCEHATGTFADPGQDNDILYLAYDNGQEEAVKRSRRSNSNFQRTRVWYGPIGSGDKLLRNTQKRNELRDRYGIIGLEMEAAGIMNRIPVGVIRGVCDYGDGHKNKNWQPYAAAMAASYARALLDEIPPSNTSRGTADLGEEIYEPCYYIPFTRNPRFTGRTVILNALEDKFFGPDQSRKVALVGLGGVGKTQIALHFAYQLKEKQPDYSIFWVPVLSNETAEHAYMDIAKKFGLQKSREDDNMKGLVSQHLSLHKAGKWLLVLDNADDQELILGSAEKPGLEEYLPQSEDGIILLTTRTRHIAIQFAQSDVIDIKQMDQEEGIILLEKSLIQKRLLQDKEAISELLAYLTFLPLAIMQAAAYLNQTKAPIRTYLGLLRNDEDKGMSVLSREFRDSTRYRGSQNAIGTTWIISFRQIQRSNQLAVDLLSFMSCIEPKAIPQSLFPDAEPEQLEWAISTLCSYSFLLRRADTNMFDMHSLVHVATRGWLEKQDRQREVLNHVICHIAARFPAKDDVHYDLRREYLPHAMRLLNQKHGNRTAEAYQLLEKVGDSLYMDRQFKEAIKCFEEVCRWRRGLNSETDGARLASEHALATAYLEDRRIKDAIELLEQVVAVQKQKLDEKDYKRLTSEHELARAYLNNRQIEDAIEILEHVVVVQKETLDEKDYKRLQSEHTLATAYLDNRRTKDAIKMLEHVVAVQETTLAESHPHRLASQHLLAGAYQANGQIQEAVKLLERVVAT